MLSMLLRNYPGMVFLLTRTFIFSYVDNYKCKIHKRRKARLSQVDILSIHLLGKNLDGIKVS